MFYTDSIFPYLLSTHLLRIVTCPVFTVSCHTVSCLYSPVNILTCAQCFNLRWRVSLEICQHQLTRSKLSCIENESNSDDGTTLHSQWQWNQNLCEVHSCAMWCSHLFWSAVSKQSSFRSLSRSLPHSGGQVEAFQPELPPPCQFRFHPLWVGITPGCCYAGWSSGWVAFHDTPEVGRQVLLL